VRLDRAQLADFTDGEVALAGIAGSSLLWLGSSIFLYPRLELLPRPEGYHPPAEIGISSPVLGLRPGRWFLSRRSKLPKPGQLHLLIVLETDADLLEEQLDDLLGLALVQPEFLKQSLCHFGFGQRAHAVPSRPRSAAQLCIEVFLQRINDLLNTLVDLIIIKRARLILKSQT
jgi:hypothetical protein